MNTFRVSLIACVLFVSSAQSAAAYLFPYDNQEYALCGWGGSCQGWFYPSQYYTRFEPDPRQYEFVETYPMGYADVAPEWRQQAMNWVDYSRVNPAFTWGDYSGGMGGYGDPTMTYTHPYDGYYSADQSAQVYGIDPVYYNMQYQYYNIAI